MPSLAPLGGTLSFAQAKHLLRRTSFHYSKARIDALTGMSVSAAVDSLFAFDYATLHVAEPVDHKTGQPWINSGTAPSSGEGDLRRFVIGWWCNEARLDPTARFRISFFLHTIMPIHTDFGPAASVYDYLALLRFHAKGSLRELAYRMTLDNVMLNYLDNDNNSKWNPNENYAREFLELFTIGKGPQIAPQNYTNYTEHDIQVGAQLLTGWRKGDRANPAHTDPVTGLTRGYPKYSHHVTGDKTFSTAFPDATGQPTTVTGATTDAEMFDELRAFVDMIFAQDETARYYARRMYRYFVGGDISTAVETDLIEPLATTLRNADYDLPTALKALFKSEFFYSIENGVDTGENTLSVLRAPLELTLQTLSLLHVEPPSLHTPKDHYHYFWSRGIYNSSFDKAGMRPFRPDSVAGYPAYYQDPIYHRIWFSSATLVARYKLPYVLIEGRPLYNSGTIGGTQLDTVAFVESPGLATDPSDSALLVADVLDYLFGLPPDADRLAYFEGLLLNGFTAAEWAMEWTDYQTTKDATGVRINLDHFFYGVLYSQEYQVQ